VLLVLVHHGDALFAEVDPQRPLSNVGRAGVDRLAQAVAAKGVKPAIIWHSGKLRAKQTAEAFFRACNPFAEFSATRDLQPEDRPEWIRDRLRGESKDILITGHFYHLPRLRALLAGGSEDDFPKHGAVALTTDDGGETWREIWRLS
jgi:phosphohistidine phosphatase